MAPYPSGLIAQVEPGRASRIFTDEVEPSTVLVKIQHARRWVKGGTAAADRFPDETTVLTSTAIKDDRNAALPLEHNGHKRGEIDIVREFEPDIHIPADRSDYADLPDARRYEEVRECMEGTIAMANHVEEQGLETQILPFLKGVTPRERYLCYRTMEQLGMEYAVFYANGYFNDGSGVRIDELVEDLETIAAESQEVADHVDGPIRLAVLNCLSPAVLERFPACVEAASGLWVGQNRGWRETVTPTKQSAAEMREIFGDVEARVVEALPGVDAGEDKRAAVTDAEAESGDATVDGEV